MATNFPRKGDDQKVTLSNSNFPQFDRGFAERLKDSDPEIWRAGGNIRGNAAFRLWGRARSGDTAPAVLSWIKEREAWAARHLKDGSQFPEASATLSSVAGVVAAIKWGVILQIGESAMKAAIRELQKKRRERMQTTTTEDRHLIGIAESAEGYVLTFAKEIPPHGPEPSIPEPGTDTTEGVTEDPPSDPPPSNPDPTPVDQGDGSDPDRPDGGRAEFREISGSTRKALENKVEEHNEDSPKYRTTLSTLSAVFRRGVGAYKTNPQSVRPNVTSPEMWAMARVNSFLYALRNDRFRSGKHDTDLLPESHPMHTEGEQKSETMTDVERRYLTPDTQSIEIRQVGDERRVEGYAAVFNSPTTIQGRRGAFREQIDRTAFEGRLEDPVVALFNHDNLRPLAKVGAGLDLSVDDYGLRYSFPVPDTTTGRDLVELMDRGIVREASFAFTIAPDGERWERKEGDEYETRTITRVGRLIDVSVVTVGAYSDASAALRSLEGAKIDEQDAPEGDTPDEQRNTDNGPEMAPNRQRNRERVRAFRLFPILNPST
jgi:HK97 family phage prohead protease